MKTSTIMHGAYPVCQLEGLQAGADDYLPKPFSMPILLARMHNLLKVDKEFLQRAIGLAEEHMDDFEYSVKAPAPELHMADRTLRRKLSAMVDQSPAEFIRILRLKRAAQLLKESGGNISDIAAQVGFLEPTHFSRGFKSQFGMSPTEFRKDGVAHQ